MYPLPRTPLVALLAVAVLTSGCVTVAGNKLHDLERRVPATVPRVEETVGEYSFHLDGGKMITSNKAGRLLNAEILGRWKKWGYISGQTYVKSGAFSGNAEYEITLSGDQDGDSSILLQIISGLTLMVIPYYVDSGFNVVYEVRDVRTNKTFRAQASESYNTIISLLLLPFSPFGQGGASTTYDRIAANLYDQLRDQGAFVAQSAEPGGGL